MARPGDTRSNLLPIGLKIAAVGLLIVGIGCTPYFISSFTNPPPPTDPFPNYSLLVVIPAVLSTFVGGPIAAVGLVTALIGSVLTLMRRHKNEASATSVSLE